MRTLILAAGVAALAITAPAAAKPDRDGDRKSQVKRGGGKAKAQRGGERRSAQVQRRGGNERRAAQMQRRGGERQAQRMERRGNERRAQRMERRSNERRAQRMERRGNERRAAVQRERNERRAQRVERRGGNERRFANFQRERNERRAERLERRGNDRRIANAQRERNERRAQRIERRQDERRFVNLQRDRNERRADRIERRAERRQDFARDARRVREARERRMAFVNQRENRIFESRRRIAEQRNYWRDRDDGPRFTWRDRDDDFRRVARWRDWGDNDWNRYYAYRGIPAAYVGCPPGLAKKSWSCVPPGRAREMFIGRALPAYYASNYIPLGLRDIYYDTDDYYYRWGDGYAYRVDRDDDLVLSLLPLIGAGFGVGQYFPYYQQPAYYVPSYYQSFYPSYGDDYYRYANGYVYEIDGSSGYIEDVIPLLDRGYGIGQMLPAGYSYYNVPYQYRDYYYDTDDYYYRYAPGAIYQVDRDSMLITAIASLLTGGMSVGQPLPPAYSVYNVPLSYRDRYYDTPDSWYRYSDGYIYQVDPRTRLITAMVQALV